MGFRFSSYSLGCFGAVRKILTASILVFYKKNDICKKQLF